MQITTAPAPSAQNGATDLNTPSFAGARQIARDKTLARMQGRQQQTKDDVDFFAREFSALLWLVPIWDGGFCHADEKKAKARVRQLGLEKHYLAGLVKPTSWPKLETAVAA